MLTIVCMALLLAFLGFIILFADKKAKSSVFFDIDVTNCMRGFWCIIILLVHIPQGYQNFIQNALGSFAYIGVTFFFMASGYGLMLVAERNPDGIIKGFWKRRLPKLLVPMLLVNLIRFAAKLLVFNEILPFDLIGVTGFVRQLLFFYFIFWLVLRFVPVQVSLNTKGIIICCCVLVFSVLIYIWDNNPLFAWPVESFGFAYGTLLSRYKGKFIDFANRKWYVKIVAFCCLSAILGIVYLFVKNVAFFGDYILRIALGVAILMFILLLNTKLRFGNSVGRFLGGISYEVYLIHDIAFIILAAIYKDMNSGVFIVLSIIITIALSMVVNKISRSILGLKKKKG